MIYQQLSELYGWTPRQINELTLFQAAAYLGGITPEHGRVKLRPEQAIGLIQKRQLKRHGL